MTACALFIASLNTICSVENRSLFLCGGAAAAVDIGIFFLFAKLAGYDYLLVGCVGFLVATAVNYVLSVKRVFRSGVRYSKGKEVALVYIETLLYSSETEFSRVQFGFWYSWRTSHRYQRRLGADLLDHPRINADVRAACLNSQ